MRVAFEKYFDQKYPGMSHDTETFRDEWEIWSEAFVSGVLYIVEGIVHRG
jgi:hypothetical protein